MKRSKPPSITTLDFGFLNAATILARLPKNGYINILGSRYFAWVSAIAVSLQKRNFVWVKDRARRAIRGLLHHLRIGFSCGWSMAKDFLNLDGWRVIDFESGATATIVDAVVESLPAGCSNCGLLAMFLQKHGTKRRELADIPVRGRHVFIRFERQRYICLNCQATVFQPLPGVNGTNQMTTRLAEFASTRAVREPFITVADETGLSDKTIRLLFRKYAKQTLEHRTLETPRSLGIDDVYVERRARCALVDNEQKRFYEILPRRNKTFLYRFLLQIPNRNRIEVVTIDMCAPFRDAVKAALPNALIIVDRFHIQAFANRAAKKVLRSFQPRKKSGKGYVRDPFLLLQDSDELDAKQKENIDRWLKKEPLVSQAYQLKEKYLGLWRCRNRDQAEAAYDDWLTQVPDELNEAFRGLMTAMKNWRVHIFNYWDCRHTNAKCEANNAIIKEIQRRGRSCDFETVRAKALCGDLLTEEKLATRGNAKSTRRRLADCAAQPGRAEGGRQHPDRVIGDHHTAVVSTRKSLSPIFCWSAVAAPDHIWLPASAVCFRD
jgi:transposase